MAGTGSVCNSRISQCQVLDLCNSRTSKWQVLDLYVTVEYHSHQWQVYGSKRYRGISQMQVMDLYVTVEYQSDRYYV